MAKEEIRTDKAPKPAGAYSQGVVANGFLYTAGFGGIDPATGKVVEGGVGAQTAQVMRNIQAVLAERGLTFADVVKTTVHLANLDDFDEFNRVYESFLEKPYPARTTVGSALKGILVEIDVVAALR
ncbi:MAG TPA: Rid family detoxifying hydrolase [Actinopolymorphaceae bacterium]|jgi:reactive intermediate/imine deaminase